MTSKADYLKKYLSPATGSQEKKKKKKSKDKPHGLRLIEEDAFLSVEAAKQKDIGSDEEREEMEVLKQSAKKAKVVHGFKQTFAQVNTPKEVKKEVLSPDHSPPRKARNRYDSDNSPVSNRRDGDNSPPRQARRRHDSDSSPPKASGRRRHDSDEDNSPPRRPATRQRHDSDHSPPRASNRKRLDSDDPPACRRQTSPLRNRRERHDSDNSPPRQRARRNSDSSPLRRRERDLSPPRCRPHNDDLSPPRKFRKVEEPKMIKNEEPDEEDSTGKTLEGKRSGLQSAKDLKEESDKLRAKNAKMFEDMDSSVSGRFAETVHRQKQTKKKAGNEDEDQEKKEREAKKTEELKEKYKSWNKGVAQIEDRKAQLEEMARVAAEPMARARDDDAMNAHLKDVLHAADPMANIIHKKRRDVAIDRGEMVYPSYQGHWVPNRFGIAPGYRWDGVDRSNGFEGKLAKTANTKAANQSEYYKSIAEYE